MERWDMSLGLAEALLLSGGGVVSLVGAGGKTSLMYRLAHELAGSGQTVLTTTTTHIHPPSPEQCAVCILTPNADRILERAGEALRGHRHITAAGSAAGSGKLSGLAPAEIERLKAARVFDWIVVEADGAAGRPLKAPAAHEPVIPPCSGWTVGVAGLQALGQPSRGPWVFRTDAFARITGLASGAAVTAEAVAAACGHEHGLFKGAPADCRCVAFLNRADTTERKAAAARIASLIQRSGGSRVRRVIAGEVLAEPPVWAVFDLPTGMEIRP
jgi:probable selenium-dependent hydroxylase accessory protein YqeC